MKKVLSSLMVVIFVLCSGIFHVQAEALTTSLNQAQTIEVRKSWFSFNKEYKIYADGEKVGKVEGLYFNVFGERLVLEDLSGNIYGSEQQIKRWNIRLNRLAQVYNGVDETVGFIGEEVIQDFFRWGKTFHFYDESRQEIAVSKQKMFRIFPEFIIEDMSGNELYRIKKKFSLFNTKYEISVYDTSILPVEQSIFITCILDAIKATEDEE